MSTFLLNSFIVVSQRLNSFFASSPELRDLTHRAQLLAVWQRRFQKTVPPSLASASRVIGFEQPILTLGADNSAIAAKLRNLAPQILKQLQGNDPEVTGILVKVQVAQPLEVRSPAVHSLGITGRQQIADLAANMPDSPLKQALQRLLKL